MKNFESTIKEAIIVSKKFGRSWLMSNGKQIKTAYTETEKELKKNRGFWVAAVYEIGVVVGA